MRRAGPNLHRAGRLAGAWRDALVLWALQVGHQRDVACGGLLLKNVHQLPPVLTEGVQDIARVVRQERRHEVLPFLHAHTPLLCSLRWVLMMHSPMITSSPPSSAIRRASSFTMSFCSHSTLAPTFTACLATSGVSSARRNTLTASMRSGTSRSDG